MIKKLLFLSFWYCVQTLAQAPAQQFTRTYGGSKADIAQAVKQTSDGGYVIVGSTKSSDGILSNHYGNPGINDLLIVKVTAGGVLQWKAWLGGTEDETATSVQQTTDGGYIVAGYTRSGTNDAVGNAQDGSYNWWIIKLNSNGAVTWKKYFGSTSDDKALCVIQTADGGYAVGGYIISDSGSNMGKYGKVLKLNASGNLVWSFNSSSFDNSEIKSVHQLSDGSYVAAGTRGSNFWIVKMDSAGDATTIASYGGSGPETCNSMTPTSDGGYILTGTTSSTDGDVTGFHGGNYDYWVVKVDANLNLVWQKTLGGSGDEQSYGVRELEGGYIIAGSSNSTDGDVTPLGNGDAWVVKLSTTGNIIWQGSYGTATDNEQVLGMDITSDFGIALVGLIGGGTIDPDFYLIKIEGSCPIAPFVDPQTVCANSTVSTLTANGQNLKWYTTQTGGTPLDPSTVVNNGIYYVSQTVNGCESTRTMVNITITTLFAPATGTQQNICGPATLANLGATGVDGCVIKWYSSASSTTPLPITTPINTGYYYATQSVGNCESPRSMVRAFVTNVYAPTVNSPYNYCGSPDYPLTVSILNAQNAATGINLRWYTQPTGGSSLAQTAVINSGTYYVSQTINTCQSPRSEVVINSYIVDDMAVITQNSSFYVMTPTPGVTYNWVTCPDRTVVGSGLTFAPTSSGSYGFEATVTATGCKIYSPCGYVNVLGQDSFVQKPKITIHPNPAQNILNLETDEDILETNIYDMMGRRTHHEILNKNINVQHLSDGLYLLEVKTTLGTYQEKFLKN